MSVEPQSEQPSAQTQPRDRVGAGYALILVLIGVIGINLPHPKPMSRPDFELHGWEAGLRALQKFHQDDIELLKKNPPTEAAARLITAFEQLGRIEAVQRSTTDKDRLKEATLEAANASVEFWFKHGEDAWRGLGTFMFLRFEKALDQVLAARDVDGATLSRWLINHRDHAMTRRLRESSGTFVEFAIGSGLLSERGYMAGGDSTLLRIHFQGRWYLLLQSVRDYMQLYRRDELLAKWRWSLEGDRNLSMAQRLKKARQLRKYDPTYPVYASLGALYAKRGQTVMAIDAYRNALLEQPFEPKIANNLAFLVRSQLD